MNINDRLFAAITSGIHHLENSMNALQAGDKDSLMESTWHVIAELEYALFLLSIIIKNCATPEKTVDLTKKDIEIKKLFAAAHKLLKEAHLLLEEGKFPKAYMNISDARNQVLKIRKSLSKDKRNALKA